MKLVRLFILFVVFIVAGCGGAQPNASPSPVTASTSVAMPSPSVVAQVQPAPITTPELGGGLGSVRGVYGSFLFPDNIRMLTETYTLPFLIESSYDAGITSTVTITFTGEGVIHDINPASLTLVVVPGKMVVTTTFRFKEEGQGRINAHYSVYTPANLMKGGCRVHVESREFWTILATNIGVFDNQIDLYTTYLDAANTQGVISNEEYERRKNVLFTANRGLLIELNGTQEEIFPFTDATPLL